MRNMLWCNLKLAFAKQGRHDGKEENNKNSLMIKKNVNEEYKEAFRTKSYIEMCNKIEGQLIDITTSIVDQEQSSSSSLFLVNYFDISLESWKLCESLLINVHQARNNHRPIKKVIKLIKRILDDTNWTQDQYHAAYRNLAAFASQTNPFSTEKFHELHNTHIHLLHELTSQCKKIKKRTRLARLIKRGILASLLVMEFGALAFTLIFLILAIHCMVGVLVAPGLAIWSLGHFRMKKMKMRRKWNETWIEKLDIATRGVYIMINDFDTMSRVVKRLHDEMEHRKFVADVCVRKGKSERLKEVAKEFQMNDSWFLEQLEELEKQIYLCFLDINRSRKLLIREIDKQ